MPIDAKTLKAMIDRELERLLDARVKGHIQSMRVDPEPALRNWDYGKPGEQYICWGVLNDSGSHTGIAYCENGFGPSSPWGLVSLASDDEKHMSMGMDSGWFPTFLDAYFDSCAAAELPIWRVFRTDHLGIRQAATDEGAWQATWERVAELRAADPASRYDCGHSIMFASAAPAA
jgi:hypothetical protein